jgi:hypothetical protein
MLSWLAGLLVLSVGVLLPLAISASRHHMFIWSRPSSQEKAS